MSRAVSVLRYLVPLAVLVATFIATTRAMGPALLLALLLLVLLAEAMVAEYRGRARPRHVACAAACALLPWGIAGALGSWFVPLAAWLAAVALVYLLRQGSTSDGAVAAAWREAGETFGRRRTALGRHYRWRMALAALPHLVYVFALCFLLLGVAVGLIGLGAGAAGSPETAVLGLLFGTIFTVLGVVVALPAAFGVVGVVLAPFVRGPLATLLRALLDVDTASPSAARGCLASLLVLALDLTLYVVAFGWAGVTFIGSAFPGGGSLGASFALVPLLAALGLRLLVTDVLVLESDHVVGGPARLLRALLRGPLELAELALWQLTGVGLVFVLPLVALAGTSLWLLVRDQPPWLIGLVNLAGILAIARLGAAALLRLTLHRLALLRRLEAVEVPPPAAEPVVASS